MRSTNTKDKRVSAQGKHITHLCIYYHSKIQYVLIHYDLRAGPLLGLLHYFQTHSHIEALAYSRE